MKNNYNSKNKNEQILETEMQEYYQLQQELKQLKQEPCFSLTSLILVAIGVSLF
ncbi:hypothetical protein [Candidatus Thioglobus sp.]|uniref:hypothetical protein n=1 Tax=Candidatus Thioglobus sp. TaxID=2026721 RepID=UPI003D0B1977